MNRDFLYLKNLVRNNWCEDCDINDCKNCQVKEVIQVVERLDGYYGDATPAQGNEGCHICKDKRGKSKEVLYFDAANNMRAAEYCPNCGRQC